jgi:hypothetical protein
MSNLNRNRPIVALNNMWRMYTTPVVGCTMLGTVQRQLQIDALAQLANGDYVAVKNGRIEPLVNRKIQLAIDHL